MKKAVKIIIGIVLLFLLVWVLAYFKKANSAAVEDFKVEEPFYTSLNTKTVATGKLNPEEEIELKPQVGGILDKILVEEGDIVEKGDIIAKIRVVPNEGSLLSANSRINSARLSFDNANTLFKRNKILFEKGVISKQDFENSELSMNQAKESLDQAKNDFQIIKMGSLSSGTGANTNIVAQIPGTILSIPVREGDQVIESNNFNAGTTIATVADMSVMIFEGQVDEAEVGKLKQDMPLVVTLAAIEDKEYAAKLKFIAPKGIEEGGAVQFKIEGEVYLDDEYFVRAGYSANASIVTERRDRVIAISEALLQYDLKTKEPYVEVEIGEQEFEKRDIELGLSDGVNAEVLSGVTKEDKIKIWNKTEPEKRGGGTLDDDFEDKK